MGIELLAGSSALGHAMGAAALVAVRRPVECFIKRAKQDDPLVEQLHLPVDRVGEILARLRHRRRTEDGPAREDALESDKQVSYKTEYFGENGRSRRQGLRLWTAPGRLAPRSSIRLPPPPSRAVGAP
jgi:hypothetical protein